jgi:hypothetical protein
MFNIDVLLRFHFRNYTFLHAHVRCVGVLRYGA